VKRSESSSLSIDADNTSADRTFRRNSTKFFSSLELSGLVIIAAIHETHCVILWADHRAVIFLSQGWMNIPHRNLWKTPAPIPFRIFFANFTTALRELCGSKKNGRHPHRARAYFAATEPSRRRGMCIVKFFPT
jgi:hypothetical protein